MSLSIDTRRISAVYALGQWFNVKFNTFFIDAYELRDIEESCPFGNEHSNPLDLTCDSREPHTTYYQMGGIHKKSEPESQSFVFQNSPRSKIVSLSSDQGVGFIDAKTKETVYFALMEIRAFRCAPVKEVIRQCPELKPQVQAAKEMLNGIVVKQEIDD
jgi:hypothetical protein